jgi:hypothetical protein
MASAHPAYCGHMAAMVLAGPFRPSDSFPLLPSTPRATGMTLCRHAPASMED